MPPRYAYWTIIVDNQPTAFRSGSQEELMPTFKRLKAKNDTAVMMWWQNGKLWPTRVDAQEAMIGRGEMGRRGDVRQSGSGFRDRDKKPFRERSAGGTRSAWTPRGEPSTPAAERNADNKLDWKPKGDFVPAPKRSERPERPEQTERSEWKPKGSFDRGQTSEAAGRGPGRSAEREGRPEWKPKSASFDRGQKSEAASRGPGRSAEREGRPEWKPKSASVDRERKPDWKPKGSFDREERPRSFKRPDFKPSGGDSRSAKPEWKPKGSFDRNHKSEAAGRGPRRSAERGGGLDWKPKGEFTPAPRREDGEKRKWVPKEEYKKSMGIEAKRDSKWRPGGEHKDPRQKYKDAKKAKWTKFKTNIRTKWESKKKS